MCLAGEVATHMSIVVDGQMEYHVMHPDDADINQVNCQDWIAEPVLWVADWHYLGNLRAIQPTELLRVEPQRFIQIVGLNPVALRFMTSYANKYIRRLNNPSSSAKGYP